MWGQRPSQGQSGPVTLVILDNMDPSQDFIVLLVDDEESIRRSLGRFFARSPYKFLFAAGGPEALAVLAQKPVALMLLDLKMPKMDGLAVLEKALKKWPTLKVIMLTGHGGVQEAVAAIKLGALDFVEKSASPELLRQKLLQIYQLWQFEQENRQGQDRCHPAFRFDDLIGGSPAILKLKDMIARIGPTDTTVLIQGESGTGKELIARAIHHHSHRQAEVFMPVDCAALKETVVESELFGYAKGAFTGADQAALGLIRAANKGTMFLDEVGELSLVMQAKLLRTLQERVVRPVGSTQTFPVDIRVVAATNRSLVEAVATNSFRQDLYYRLNAVTLQAPPLRERGPDIDLLARHVHEKLSREGFGAKRIVPEAMDALRAYSWPGNVRELENVIRGAMAFAEGDLIQPADLAIYGPASLSNHAAAGSLSSLEETAIRSALQKSGGSRRQAAKLLEISEATLYRRLRQYNIQP
jgi:DNA-binding NtrC family response regulator